MDPRARLRARGRRPVVLLALACVGVVAASASPAVAGPAPGRGLEDLWSAYPLDPRPRGGASAPAVRPAPRTTTPSSDQPARSAPPSGRGSPRSESGFRSDLVRGGLAAFALLVAIALVVISTRIVRKHRTGRRYDVRVRPRPPRHVPAVVRAHRIAAPSAPEKRAVAGPRRYEVARPVRPARAQRRRPARTGAGLAPWRLHGRRGAAAVVGGFARVRVQLAIWVVAAFASIGLAYVIVVFLSSGRPAP